MVVSQAVGIAVEVEHDRAVQEAVEHGGGDGGVAENLTPFSNAAVGGNDDRCLHIPLRHNLKQS